MTWKKLLANKNVAHEPPSKAELDNLRSIVARSLKDVVSPGLSTDARFVMAYDAARTLSLMVDCSKPRDNSRSMPRRG